ncbi:MAG: hypothetical protein EI684_04820 [Candidatus Viridilinea halotolerans]|uniref:Uncharacterized protein n=1 Tax=Candidatus Viridilinea halotolerans TaxID=2491704 RepID=A0A426U5S7_9CHLR|nr:MAG: hypothetical protein EI684_04820 [Candidatus Viridilinea halotolerans]
MKNGLCARCVETLRQCEQRERAAQIQQDRQAAVILAQQIEQYRYAALAIRCLGFGVRAGLCQIVVVDHDGIVIWQSYLRPLHDVASPSQRKYSIAQAQFTRAPLFVEVAQDLFEALEGHSILVDGDRFVSGVLKRACDDAGWNGLPGSSWFCMRDLYARFVGEWSPRAKKYRAQPLPERRLGAVVEATAILNRQRMICGLPPLPVPPLLSFSSRGWCVSDERPDEADAL